MIKLYFLLDLLETTPATSSQHSDGVPHIPAERLGQLKVVITGLPAHASEDDIFLEVKDYDVRCRPSLPPAITERSYQPLVRDIHPRRRAGRGPQTSEDGVPHHEDVPRPDGSPPLQEAARATAASSSATDPRSATGS